jgi:hypothetical protein
MMQHTLMREKHAYELHGAFGRQWTTGSYLIRAILDSELSNALYIRLLTLERTASNVNPHVFDNMNANSATVRLFMSTSMCS